MCILKIKHASHLPERWGNLCKYLHRNSGTVIKFSNTLAMNQCCAIDDLELAGCIFTSALAVAMTAGRSEAQGKPARLPNFFSEISLLTCTRQSDDEPTHRQRP